MPKLQSHILVLVWLSTLSARGFPVAPLNVSDTVNHSELVVVGPVLLAGVRDATIGSGADAVAAVENTYRVTADEVLKGEMPAGRSISVRYVVPKEFDPRFRPVPTPSYRICFLMRQGQGWTFTDSGYPTAPGIRLSGQPTIGEPLDAVVANLGGVLCKAPNRNEKVEALAALRSIAARKSVEAALLGDVSDPEPAIRLDVIGALLSIGNITHLGEAASALLASDGKLPDYVLHNLRVGIYTGVHQAEALPVLTDLLRSPNVVTRRAAVLAIVHTDGQAAIEPLRSGLDDPDQIVRFNCVLGLAKATGQQDWIPNMDMFKADEAKYLSHWKNEIR